jgi:hypothetical protein
MKPHPTSGLAVVLRMSRGHVGRFERRTQAWFPGRELSRRMLGINPQCLARDIRP